jgi:phosphatidylserine/phosphatidylglycerophosphate/cardiolipin synthase-like enzyme
MTRFAVAEASRLDDREYFPFTLASVESAVRRIWVSMFIQDVRPARDVSGEVLELTHALVARHRAGVDVRVLLTGHANTPDIVVANLASGLVLSGHSVPHRRVFGRHGGERAGSHAKFFVCDDMAVLGSQNWTDDGFTENIEDAVVLTGQPVDLLAQEFARLWAVGHRMPHHGAQ